MGFRDILGNTRVKKILRLALEKNRVPNSLLFCGPEGVGKKQMADILAKSLNCERKKDDACEQCSSCRAISGKRLPDVMEISPEKTEIRIDQMRAVRQTAYLRPMTARRRVFIVDEAEKMNEEASNSLLKTLEEPPLFSHIILITSNPHLVLPTIRSRCQILSFTSVEKEEIERTLIERGYPEGRAKIIALLVQGNLEQALSLDWEAVQEQRESAWKIFLSLLRRESEAAFLKAYAFSGRGALKRDLEAKLEIVSTFLRDLILLREGGDKALLLNPDFEGGLGEFEGGGSLEFLSKCLDHIDYAISVLNKNVNVRLLVSSFYSHLEAGNNA